MTQEREGIKGQTINGSRAFTPVKRYRNFIEFNEPEGSTPELLSSFVSLAINVFLGI